MCRGGGFISQSKRLAGLEVYFRLLSVSGVVQIWRDCRCFGPKYAAEQLFGKDARRGCSEPETVKLVRGATEANIKKEK